jgi:hypothetical protein
LLLKNELSLSFLRKYETVYTTVRAAIKILAAQDENRKKEIEAIEFATLEKIIRSPNQEGSHITDETAVFDKLIQKLVEYNEKINEGKELSIVEYLKRIEVDSPFLKEYETQKVIRRSFQEEFRIHCFNYILLLFESIMRILTTLNKDVT